MTTLTPGNPAWYEGSRAVCQICKGEYALDANDVGKEYMIMSEEAVQAGCPTCGAIITFWRAPSAPEPQETPMAGINTTVRPVKYTPEEQEAAYQNYRKRNPI
jgi:hypothetical protein